MATTTIRIDHTTIDDNYTAALKHMANAQKLTPDEVAAAIPIIASSILALKQGNQDVARGAQESIKHCFDAAVKHQQSSPARAG